MANKLGFYIENSTVPGLRDALRQVKPATVLFHAGDRTLLQEIRRDISPDSFIVGRFIVSREETEQWLDSADPEAAGIAYADRILDYDFGYATERANGKPLVDAWMTLNEALRGPASFENEAVDEEFRRRATNLDRFQVAFRGRLQTRGLEAVAFNFGAGNYTKPQHYLDWFPRTLASYRYLGFHEYGWPTLDPRPGTETAACYYRICLEGIRQQYGDRHRAIITEAGLARMYKYPRDPAGDVGWLYPPDAVSPEQYWETLRWYNGQLCQDHYVMGACLFEVGHAGRWETFRHLGNDNQGRPITIVPQIATLRETTPSFGGKRMQISDFPRPPEDNGRGVHWSASVYHPTGSGLDRWIAELQAMKIKWVKVLDDGGGSSLELCQRLLAAGMMPVVRLFRERPNPVGVGGRGMDAARTLIQAGVRYFETNNEPDLPDEWDGPMPDNWLDVVVDNFIRDADAILGLGGLLGFPAMGRPNNMASIERVVARGRRDLFERGCWVAIHNYTLNHPLAYPDDPVNQQGEQLTPEEYARYDPWAWDGRPRELINQWRREDKNPGQTVYQAPGGFRGYEFAGKRIFDALGFHVPVISTEGGPVVGWGDDRRYNKVVPQQQMEWLVEIARRLQTNQVPEWYFTLCTWLLAAQQLGDWNYAWEQMAWFTNAWDERFGLSGQLPAVAALKSLPSVSRLAPQGTAVLAGTLRRDSGQPLGRVALSLAAAGRPEQRLLSEPGGAFRFASLPAGTYTLSVVDHGAVAANIALSQGESKAVEVLLHDPAQASGVRGQLLAADGRTQPGAEVALLSLAGGAPQTIATETTGADGAFAFGRLGAGTWRVRSGASTSDNISLDGWSTVETTLRLPAPPGYRYSITATRPAPDATRRFLGRVLDEQGNGLNGIQLQMAWPGTPPGSGFPRTTSGQDPFKPAGNYEFIASPGQFQITVVQGDWPSETTPWLSTTAVPGQAGDSFAWEVNFQRLPTGPAPGRSVARGRIVNPPHAAVVVLAGPAMADGPRRAPLGPDGTFRFEGVPAGDEYTLALEGVAPLGGPFSLDGSNQVERNLALTGRVRGSLIGAPPDTLVELDMVSPLSWQRYEGLAASGAFRFEGLPPGQYQLRVGLQPVTGIVLAEGQEFVLPSFALSPTGPGVLRGLVQRKDGTPVAGAQVQLQRGGQAVAETRTDSQGRFTFADLAAGAYRASLPAFGIAGECSVAPAAEANLTLIVPDAAPPARVLKRYVLVGRAGQAQARLRILQDYLAMHPETTVGFSADEAIAAETVILLGDTGVIGPEVEQRLRAAGCAVERVPGDLYAQASGLK